MTITLLFNLHKQERLFSLYYLF